MLDTTPIDNIRRTASAIVFVSAFVVAALFLKLLTMVDFAEQLQVMLLVATALIFATVGAGLVALGAYCRFWIARAVGAPEA